MAVYRQAGANAVEVANRIRALLPAISAELPGSVRITPLYDRSRGIVNSVNDVQETLAIAFVLVVLVIFLFLGRATDTLIPAVALPISLLLTFIAMQLLGYSLDNLSLMALTLAIGFLVDDAIVFLGKHRAPHGAWQNARWRRRSRAPRKSALRFVSMTISLGGGVHSAGFHVRAWSGRIFREFAITIVVAIMASGLVSLTLTPLMCARLLKARGEGIQAHAGWSASSAAWRGACSARYGRIAQLVYRPALDLCADLAGLPCRHGLVFSRRAESVLTAGRQQRGHRCFHRSRRFVAGANARDPGPGGRRASGESRMSWPPSKSPA